MLKNNIIIKIRKTDRKRTISIQVLESYVQVLAPKRVSDSEISKFIKSKSNWINKKIELLKARPVYNTKKFVDGEKINILARILTLKICQGIKENIHIKDDTILIQIKNKEDNIKQLLEGWIKKYSYEHLKKRTLYFERKIGVSSKKISIKNYKKRWGCCSLKGDIIYNWRILMAPPSIVDYVIVHELCHLIHHNHSKQYWDTVEKYCSDYKEKRNWFVNNSKLLEW